MSMRKVDGKEMIPPKTRQAPLKVALLYTAVAAAWFIGADRMIVLLVPAAEQAPWRRALEGWLFLILTATLLYFLVRHYLLLVRQRETRLREILLGLSVASGEAFFRSTVESLCSTFGADAALLCEFPGDDRNRLRMLAGWREGKAMPPHECPRQQGGPCMKILQSEGAYVHETRLEKGFTCLGWTDEKRRGSFEGAPLLDSRGDVMGVLTLLHFRPLRDQKLAEELLPLIALQAATELERRRAEEELRSSEERFRSVFDTAAAGMVIMNPKGAILQSNGAFRQFLGYREEELTRMNIADVTHPEDRDLTVSNYRDLLAGREKSLHYEKRYLTRSGETVWGHASVACLVGGDTSSYCIGLVQDITERRRAEDELRRLNRELDAFVYTVSHDLRSPLTPIIGYSEYLCTCHRDRIPPETLGMLAEIKRQAEKMLALLEDLLALAKVGKVECPLKPVDCEQVAKEAIRELREGSDREVPEIRLSTPLPAVGVPETLLYQVFTNLIGNAAEYGASGGAIEIGGERVRQRVLYFVRDHGPGIPKEEREEIFDAFSRGSTGRHKAGTGIGLAIVQKVARLYHGRAWVDETPGGGATFWVELIDECCPDGACRAAGQSPVHP